MFGHHCRVYGAAVPDRPVLSWQDRAAVRATVAAEVRAPGRSPPGRLAPAASATARPAPPAESATASPAPPAASATARPAPSAASATASPAPPAASATASPAPSAA